MIKHLHIGRSDAIGRYYSSLSNTLVIGHHELSLIKKTEFSSVSISAFNPARKNDVDHSDDFIKRLCLSIPSWCHVIYFSTARVLDSEHTMRHAAYVRNKISDEMYLSNFFDNLSVVYLPLIIPTCQNDKNVFLEMFFRNLKLGSVVFDVDLDSSWNFIHPTDLKFLVSNTETLGRKQLLVSKKSFTGHDFLKFGKYLGEVRSVRFGSGVVNYPVKNEMKTFYGKFDFFDDLNWLDTLHRIYK